MHIHPRPACNELVGNRNTPRKSTSTAFSSRLVARVAPLVLALAALPLNAATEFEDSIPIEVARIFLDLRGTGDAAVYQDIMDEFPSFTVPDAFEVLGSLDQVYLQRVVLRTDLAPDAAKAAITDAFTAEDWEVMDLSRFRGAQQGGFVAATQPEVPAQLCHDDYGMMQVGVSTSPQGRLVSLSRSPAAMQGGGFANSNLCDPARFGAVDMMGPGARAGVMTHMPTLVMPEAPAARNNMSPGFFGGGGGGSPDDFETRTPFSSELSLQALYEHFATQIAEQDWTTDNESTGSFLATGSFTKTVEGDIELIGMLTVLEVAENSFDLKFRIVRKGGGGRPGAGIRIMNDPQVGVRVQTRDVVTSGASRSNAPAATIISRVEQSSADSAQRPGRTLSLQVPDFRPALAADRRYYVVEFSEHGSSVEPGRVNSEGVLTATLADFSGLAGAPVQAPEAERHNWFFSVHQDTGQLLFTLDLDDVPLTALVSSLAMALEKSGKEEMLQGPGVRDSSVRPAENIRLKIRGNHMTLRETLDLIYQQTGCSVFREQGRLLMTVCE